MPVGFLNGIWLVVFPLLGIGLLWAFLAYELNQSAVLGDGAYQDIIGHVIGIIASGVLWTVLFVLLILWFGGLTWR